MTLIQVFYREHRKSLQNAKGMAQVSNTHKTYSTNVCNDGGYSRSSDETFVMKVEQRAVVIQFQVFKQL